MAQSPKSNYLELFLLLSFSYMAHWICQQVLLALPLKYIQELNWITLSKCPIFSCTSTPSPTVYLKHSNCQSDSAKHKSDFVTLLTSAQHLPTASHITQSKSWSFKNGYKALNVLPPIHTSMTPPSTTLQICHSVPATLASCQAYSRLSKHWLEYFYPNICRTSSPNPVLTFMSLSQPGLPLNIYLKLQSAPRTPTPSISLTLYFFIALITF